MTLIAPYSASFIVGDGETKVFPFVFEEVSENFVKVIVSHADGTTSIPTYTVDLDLKQVVFGDETPAPLSTDVVCIYRETPVIQDTAFRTLEGYNARALENILSKIVAMIQEIKSTYFSTQVLQGDPWQLDLLKAEDDGATVKIDYTAKKLVKGLYFKITNGNLQVSEDDSIYITMPKSADIAEFRQNQIVRPDLTVIYKLQYRIGNTWYDADSDASSKADEAIAIAEEARDIANDAKDIAQDAKDTADGLDGRLILVETGLSTHVGDKNNPHEVTKAQVGLGNVDNTADLDKPVIIKSATIPTASADLVGKEYQYFGTTNGTYTHGFIYECVAKTTTDTLILFDPVGTGKLAFDYTNHSVYELFERIAAIETTFNAEDVVSGSFRLDKTNELWYISGYDANGDALFTDFTVEATGGEYCLDGYGYIYTFPFPDDYEDGHTEDFRIVENTHSTYSWERIDVQPKTEVIDNLTSTSTTAALSANQGKVLNDRIDDVSGRGRFLALWNCATGLAESNPPESPYPYKAGDYFVVGTVSAADPAVNYKPNGSSYTTGVASTTVETDEVSVNDTYFYDGTVWKLQSNAQKEVALSGLADVSLGTLEDGQALIYDTDTGKWTNGNGGVSATYDAGTKTITFA